MTNNKSFLFLIILCFLLTIKTNVILVSAQDQQCLAKGSFNTNSTFNKNRLLLLSSLPSNVTAQNNFFYNSSLGQDRDKIYALAMCIPDTETEDCSNCVKTTSDGLIKTCPNNTEAFHWSGGEKTLCFVRYSTRSFIGSPDMDPRQILPNATDITSNLTDFDGIWQYLMLSMVDSASSKYYEAETRPLTSTSSGDRMTIYTIMQCTSDVSRAECNTCLRNSVGDYQNCCRGKQGGLVTRPNCIFRWEFYPFYGAFRNTSPPAKKDGSSTVKIVVPVLVVASLLILAVVGYVLYRRRKKNNKDSLRETYQELDTAEVEALSSLKFEFRVIQVATSDFSEESKLGEGGFGPVYKGKLQNGEEIAVKRLALSSGQGEEEFKNEVLLLSKLQHRNLVKLLGFCLKGEERLLIYEFVPNSSLDHFIFEVAKQDHTLSLKASWSTRYSIIENIARGILYLHEDSRLKIIHRDLKPSNILLDYQMNPKISDFGMARLFESDDQTQGLTTSRVMGTYGYMAPEYIARGRLSVKTDVYSYGIMVLEIICGRKNNSFQPSGVALHAWTNWRGDRALDIVDSVITENVSRNEVMKCINIGLLCVQESVTRRPNMNSVVHWLKSNSVTLPVPSTPAYVVHSESGEASRVSQSTVNVSITELEPR
ncbi:cysteine-rich receptor-like protein kinase 44 [Brassica napus]|uniref:cysteine-rich receptor-like protein kinase 44 n=1 Tax=Brassica napus TaxID=3708 RepID=UPI000BBE8A48|nr:cysteine-rich receptor-like protein kinase 44 [Brassica napus]